MRQALTPLALMKYRVSMPFETKQCLGFVKNDFGETEDFQPKVFV